MNKELVGVVIQVERNRCWVCGRWAAKVGYDTRTVDWRADNWLELQDEALAYLQASGVNTVTAGTHKAPRYIAEKAKCSPPPDYLFTW